MTESCFLTTFEDTVYFCFWKQYKPNGNEVVYNETWSARGFQYHKEVIHTDVNMCINMTGKWNTSRADIMLTLYFNNCTLAVINFCKRFNVFFLCHNLLTE